jgi:hypothetical protein
MRSSSGRILASAFFVVLLLLPAGPSASGQCLSDGLQGGACCQPADLQLPAFPAIQQRAKFICFENCRSRFEGELCIDLAVPRQVNVEGVGRIEGLYFVLLTIRTCSLNPRTLWTSNLRATYSRSWSESLSGSGPPDAQVWRFLLNSNLAPSDFLVRRFGANACALPPCASAYPKPHFAGYIDYARNCTTGEWQAALALQHDCDAFEHGVTSDRPGSFHPGLSYVFVAPSDTFVVNSTTLLTAFGAVPSGQEAVRRNQWSALPDVVLFEETISSGSVSRVRSFCACTTAPTTDSQFVEIAVSGNALCGSQYESLSDSRIFVQKRIGRWNRGAGLFPGQEVLLFAQGYLQYRDACTASSSVQYFKGIVTIGGFPAFTSSLAPLANQFIDLGSVNRSPTNPSTSIGVKYISDFLISMNLQ